MDLEESSPPFNLYSACDDSCQWEAFFLRLLHCHYLGGVWERAIFSDANISDLQRKSRCCLCHSGAKRQCLLCLSPGQWFLPVGNSNTSFPLWIKYTLWWYYKCFRYFQICFVGTILSFYCISIISCLCQIAQLGLSEFWVTPSFWCFISNPNYYS
jgi:hypothetical protein